MCATFGWLDWVMGFDGSEFYWHFASTRIGDASRHEHAVASSQNLVVSDLKAPSRYQTQLSHTTRHDRLYDTRFHRSAPLSSRSN